MAPFSSRLSPSFCDLWEPAKDTMEKRDYDTIFILAICILVAIKIAQASEEDAYTPQQPANMNNFHCGQPEFSTRPILLTKPGYPDQLNVVEDNYLQGFSIIHDNKNSVTIQIFCSAAYDVAIDVHNWNLVKWKLSILTK